MVRTGQEYRTLARLCEEFQVGYGRLERAVRKLDVPPAFVLNACPYYDEAAVEKIRRAVKGDEGLPDAGGQKP